MRQAFADGRDFAGYFKTRREGKGRLDLIPSKDHQRVAEVDAAGVYGNFDLTRPYS
jgi:hypothetical protein